MNPCFIPTYFANVSNALSTTVSRFCARIFPGSSCVFFRCTRYSIFPSGPLIGENSISRISNPIDAALGSHFFDYFMVRAFFLSRLLFFPTFFTTLLQNCGLIGLRFRPSLSDNPESALTLLVSEIKETSMEEKSTGSPISSGVT